MSCGTIDPHQCPVADPGGGMRPVGGVAKGVMPRGNVEISLPEETSPKVQYRGISGNTKRTCPSKIKKYDLMVSWQSFWTWH